MDAYIFLITVGAVAFEAQLFSAASGTSQTKRWLWKVVFFFNSNLKAGVWSAEIYLQADEECVWGFPVVGGTKALRHPIKVQHQISSS